MNGVSCVRRHVVPECFIFTFHFGESLDDDGAAFT